MKKGIVLILTLVFLSKSYSQDNMGSFRIGYNMFVSTNNNPLSGVTGVNHLVGGGINYLRAISNHVTVGANIDYMAGQNSSFLFNLEPRLDYFFNVVFKGAHIGTALGYNISGVSGGFSTGGLINTSPPNFFPTAQSTQANGSSGFNLGLNVGYMAYFGDFKIDFAIAPGFWYNMTNSDYHGITVKPTISLGYAF